MPRARVALFAPSALIALVAAWSLAGCLPASVRPTASIGASGQVAGAAPPAGPCAQLSAALSERTALGDAFRAAIDGDLADAARQAHAVRARLAVLVEALPEERGLTDLQASLRSLAEGAATLIGMTAATLDDPEVGVVDRDALLHEGRVMLETLDWTLAMREPGDTIDRGCPGLGYAPDQVSFPPPPSNEALGLPVTVGAALLEPHVWRIDGRMAGILEPLGVDTVPVRYIDVWLSPGGGRLDVYDGVKAPALTVATAIAAVLAPGAAGGPPQEIAGFAVLAFRQPDSDLGTLHVAMRGDRLLVFRSVRDALVRDILEALP